MIPVVIRVLVLERFVTNVNYTAKQLIVQEEVIEVSGTEVRQIDVAEVVMELDDSKHVIKRTMTVVQLSEAEVHKRPQENDKHNYYGDEGELWKMNLSTFTCLNHSECYSCENTVQMIWFKSIELAENSSKIY